MQPTAHSAPRQRPCSGPRAIALAFSKMHGVSGVQALGACAAPSPVEKYNASAKLRHAEPCMRPGPTEPQPKGTALLQSSAQPVGAQLGQMQGNEHATQGAAAITPEQKAPAISKALISSPTPGLPSLQPVKASSRAHSYAQRQAARWCPVSCFPPCPCFGHRRQPLCSFVMTQVPRVWCWSKPLTKRWECC